jgi:hypothetical protein
MQKRTVTIRFELTKYQVNQLRTLGRTLWPAINLPCDELCRRVLLDGVTGAWSEAVVSAYSKPFADQMPESDPSAPRKSRSYAGFGHISAAIFTLITASLSAWIEPSRVAVRTP